MVLRNSGILPQHYTVSQLIEDGGSTVLRDGCIHLCPPVFTHSTTQRTKPESREFQDDVLQRCPC